MKFLPSTLIFWSFILNNFAKAITGWNYRSDSPNKCDGKNITCGPGEWYKVEGAEVCQSTHTSKQSPINIVQATLDSTIDSPTFYAIEGGCKKWSQFTDDHTFEVSYAELECKNLYLGYGNTSYTLIQNHFHSPSEHTVGGGYYDAEVHLVHKSLDGKLLVLGVFLEESSSSIVENNLFLNQFWTKGIAPYPVDESSSNPINPYSDFLPASPTHFVYSGSLTTPPCTEMVTWLVYQEPVKISEKDLKKLRDAMSSHPHNILSEKGNNNRPVQALNDRHVILSQGNVIKTKSKTNIPTAQSTPRRDNTDTNTKTKTNSQTESKTSHRTKSEQKENPQQIEKNPSAMPTESKTTSSHNNAPHNINQDEDEKSIKKPSKSHKTDIPTAHPSKTKTHDKDAKHGDNETIRPSAKPMESKDKGKEKGKDISKSKSSKTKAPSKHTEHIDHITTEHANYFHVFSSVMAYWW
eukprot:gene904-1752_t